MDYDVKEVMGFNAEQVKEIEGVFLSLEEEYINQLIKVPAFYKIISMYFSFTNEELMAIFKSCHEKMENGLVTEQDEDKVELQMIASTLAMSDKIKQLILMKRQRSNRGDGSMYERSR